jgi:predicted nucleic acid-binding protein
MTSLFFDTNVIIDFLTDRKPFAEDSAAIFDLVDKKIIKGYVSAISFTNIYYMLRKVSTHEKVIRQLSDFSEIMNIINTSSIQLNYALKSDFSDFEDAIQYYSAIEIPGLKAIITRNVKDFKVRDIAIMTPKEFLEGNLK